MRQQTPIDALLQNIAAAHVERESLLQLIRDQAQLLEWLDTGSLETDAEYRALHESVRKRTRELLGG